MARPLRIEYPGALYHVTARGNARQPIFLSKGDALRFLDTLGDTALRLGWRFHGIPPAWATFCNPVISSILP